MRFGRMGACLVAVAAMGTVGVAAAPAVARVDGGDSLYAPSALVLSVGKGGDPATVTVQRAVTLRCSPSPFGDHPAPADACAELRAVGGDFDLLVADGAGTPCTRIWDPVTITADGVWEGRRVTFSHTFGNSCLLHRSDTGVVFAF